MQEQGMVIPTEVDVGQILLSGPIAIFKISTRSGHRLELSRQGILTFEKPDGSKRSVEFLSADEAAALWDDMFGSEKEAA